MAWHAAGFAGLSVAVNLSAKQGQQQDVPALVRQVLRQTGLPAHCQELEPTEFTLMHDTDTAVEAMRQIKQLGVRLALDHFCTGDSSLSHLKRFPIDVLKIDQSVTFEVTTGEGAASITRAIIAMARVTEHGRGGRRCRDRRANRLSVRRRLRPDAGLVHQPAAAGGADHRAAGCLLPVRRAAGGPGLTQACPHPLASLRPRGAVQAELALS